MKENDKSLSLTNRVLEKVAPILCNFVRMCAKTEKQSNLQKYYQLFSFHDGLS